MALMDLSSNAKITLEMAMPLSLPGTHRNQGWKIPQSCLAMATDGICFLMPNEAYTSPLIAAHVASILGF